MAGILHIQPPVPYLQTVGAPATPWDRWIQGVQAYFAAAGVTDEVQKRHSLVHLLGHEGQRQSGTIDKFQLYDDKQAFNEALTAHFKTPVNAMVERRQFRARTQHFGEPVQEFVVALRELAATCKFGALEDEMIRDQFLEHNANRRVRERLYQEPDTLKLTDAIRIAKGIKAAMAETKDQSMANQVEPSSTWTKGCNYCGRRHGRDRKACLARNKTCNGCKKTGHFEVVCRSSKNYPTS